MSNFINNLINRHVFIDSNVKPRLRARFEPESISPAKLVNDIFSEESPNNLFLSTPSAQQVENNQTPFDTQSTRVGQVNGPAQQNIVNKSNRLINEPLDEFRLETQHIPVDLPQSILGQPVHSSPVGWLKTANQPIVQTTLPADYAEKPTEPNLKANRYLVHTDQTDSEGNKPFRPLPVTSNREVQGSVKPVLPARYAADIDWKVNSNQADGLLGKPVYQPHFFINKPPKEAANELTVQTQPVIKVTIGRIDVRAVSPSATAKTPAKAELKPLLSLEDYLKQRSNRR